MAQEIKLEIKGIKTNPSQLQQGGSVEIAKNVILDRPNVAESRRGVDIYLDTETENDIDYIIPYNDYLLTHSGQNLGYVPSTGTPTYTEYSNTYENLSPVIGMRHIEANNNLYFTSTKGVYKIDTIANEPALSGGIKALSADVALTGISGFMATDTQVAYRIVWGITDDNGVVVIGAPSDRIEITNNTGATRDVAFTIYIPNNVTTSHFYQIYRSAESASATTPGSDEMYLVYEGFPTSGEITSGTISYTDNIPNSLVGATLYTSPTQEGILQANEKPPLCYDMSSYKGSVWYANTRTRHRFFLTLLSAGSTSGIQVDDTITIAGITLTGKASEDTSAGEFLISTAATPAERIAETARSIVKCFNLNSSNVSFSSYYISGFDDLPGKILVERDDLTDEVFYATSSDGDNFSPALPSSGETVGSENERKPNRIYYSKAGEIEAVPIVNYIDLGVSDSSILRVIGLRDSLIAFKSDGEVYRIYGEDPDSFQARLFDNTVRLIAPKSAVPFANSIYAYTDQGVISVTDAGIELKSYDIEDEIQREFSETLNPDVTSKAFGIGYETDRKYMIVYENTWYVYHLYTNAWTKWDLNADFGIIDPSVDKIILSEGDVILAERKSDTVLDYADISYTTGTIESYTGNTVTVNGRIVGHVAGMTLYQNGTYSYITAISEDAIADTTTYTLEESYNWELDATAEIYTPIECKLQWLPIHGGNPGLMKRFREISLYFEDLSDSFNVGVYNNFRNDPFIVSVPQQTTGDGYGETTYGEGDYGGTSISGNQEHRLWWPIPYQRAIWSNLYVSTARSFTKFTLYGAAITFEANSEKYAKIGVSNG